MTTAIYQGDYKVIPDDATPGILFLKALMTNLDSMMPKQTNLRDVLDESIKLFANGTSLTLTDLEGAFVMRSQMMTAFHHVLIKAWDVENADGTRNIMWESVSYSQFPGMAPADSIQVSEFATASLKKDPGAKTGFIATEMKSYLDPSPVREYMAGLKK